MLIGIDASRAAVARRTGTEFYSLRLIQGLLALEAPHRFRLYFNGAPKDPGFYQSERGPDPDSVESRVIPWPRLWTHLRLGLEVALCPPDLLFVPSHVLPLWTRPPAAVTVHDLGFLHFPEAHPLRQRRYLDWSTRHNARTARVVIADSGATRRDLVAYYGTRPTKIVVAHPGIDEALAPVTDPAAIDAVRRRYGIRGDYFLHLGTLQPRKNLTRLVRAFADLHVHVDRGLKLVLAGKKGWLYEEVFREVGRLGLGEWVLFPGYVDEADKAALLSGALGYVFPSLYEGFGFPALEAQACDTPLICSNSSSLPEVAGDGALLVPPDDREAWTGAMARLLGDPSLRVDLVARGRRNRERFSWRACARTVLAALEAAVEREK